MTTKTGTKKLKKINPKKNEQSSCSLSRVVIEQFTSIFYNELHSHFFSKPKRDRQTDFWVESQGKQKGKTRERERATWQPSRRQMKQR